jgi:hypothetical protein
MSDLRDLSELPNDEAYWRNLESRVLDDLRARQREGGGDEMWFHPLAKRAAGLGWLAAAGLAALLLGSRGEHEAVSLPFLQWPDDPLAEAILAPAPPPLVSLLISGTGESK